MCVTTAVLFEASGGSDDSSVLNGPPSNGRQHAGFELAVICVSEHGAVASAAAELGVRSPATDARTTPAAVAAATILSGGIWRVGR